MADDDKDPKAPLSTKDKNLNRISTAANAVSKAIMDQKHPTFDATDHTPATPPSFKKGGPVGKAGGTVEEGEVVIPKNKVGSMAKDTKDGTYTLQGGEQVTPKEKAEPKNDVSLYRAMHQLRGGKLHAALGVPADSKIPAEKMDEAHASKNPHVAAMAKLHAMREK